MNENENNKNENIINLKFPKDAINFKIPKNIDAISVIIKQSFLNILLNNQSEVIKEKILDMIENGNDPRFKKINMKIDLFIDRVQTLIQNFVQTIITTGIKVTTSWMPGVSFIGSIITTVINWSILSFKTASRSYDLYKIYYNMQDIIQSEGGKKFDLSKDIGNLQNKAIKDIANIKVPEEIGKYQNKLQEKKDLVSKNVADAANSSKNVIAPLQGGSCITCLSPLQNGGKVTLKRKNINKQINIVTRRIGHSLKLFNKKKKNTKLIKNKTIKNKRINKRKNKK